jgi:hypothetical protein
MGVGEGMAVAETVLGVLLLTLGPRELPCMGAFGSTALIKAVGYGIMATGNTTLGLATVWLGIALQAAATAVLYAKGPTPSAQRTTPKREVVSVATRVGRMRVQVPY